MMNTPVTDHPLAEHPIIGVFPENWATSRFGREFEPTNERNGEHPIGPMLSVSEYRGIEVRTNFRDGQLPSEDVAHYRVVRPGQLVANMMWLDHGGLGVSSFTGYVSPAYMAFNISDRVNPAFAHHVLRSSVYVDSYKRLGRGVRPNSQMVDSVDLRLLPFPVPPLETQQRIADYLDRETAEIDAAVADLDKYVELLEKRRRIIIVDGFNDPTYNPIVQRLKFLTVSEDHRRIPIKSGDRVAMAGEYPYYGASGIIDYVNDYLWDNEKRLLLSEDGANLVMRNHPVAFVADGQYWVNNHAHVLKCVGDTSPELVALAIEVTSIAHLITGSAQPKLTAAAMGEISFMFPHSAAKQDALLKKLKPELHEIDALIAESTKLRDLLLKRRSVLITEVVTGRKQV